MWKSRGENNKFSQNRGKCTETAKMGKNSKIWVNDYEKIVRNLVNENQKFFREKVTLGKFSTEPEQFSEIGGNLKQGEMHHCLRGGWTPLNRWTVTVLADVCFCRNVDLEVFYALVVGQHDQLWSHYYLISSSCSSLQLAPNRDASHLTYGYTDIRWRQTANYGFVPNPILKKAFLATAIDLPDVNSTYGRQENHLVQKSCIVHFNYLL